MLLLTAGGQDDDWKLVLLPHAGGHDEAVDVRQTEVEQHRVGRPCLDLTEGLRTRRGLSHVVAVVAERERDDAAHLGIVFNHQQE